MTDGRWAMTDGRWAMGDMKKLAAAVVLSAATVTAQSPADVRTLAKQSLAQIDGEIDVTGLKAPVTVVRDRWGVPHITAQSTDDLFFAQGYVMAQDRLWQMEMWRRSAEGRMAEIGRASCRE